MKTYTELLQQSMDRKRGELAEKAEILKNPNLKAYDLMKIMQALQHLTLEITQLETEIKCENKE